MRPPLLSFLSVLLLFLLSRDGSGPPPSVRAQPLAVAANERFGFVFVNGAGYDVADRRYRQAREAGATWTRWPLYWHEIETEPGRLDDEAYRLQDAVVNRDRQHGLQSNAILLGTPHWASTAGSSLVPLPPVGIKRAPLLYGITSVYISSAASIPANLYAPVFNPDGTINPQNYWARFVYTTVSRYKDRIKVWELWNEPDLKSEYGSGVFWTGSREDYYQLLKVGYQAAKAADPGATVLLSGLAFWTDKDFFPALLELMARDPTAPGRNYYFDVLPWHLYVSPYHLYHIPVWSRELMRQRGFTKPIWVNETNLPVCDDRQVDPDFFCPSLWRGTMAEQANFVIQASALAAAAGVERIFGFQLYDDDVGQHEWYGFLRNDGSARPSYAAYRTAATYLQPAPEAKWETKGSVDVVVLTGTPAGRVTVLWNRGPGPVTARLPATAGSALVVNKEGQEQPLNPQEGHYSFALPGATHRDPETREYDVGGDPLLLIEEVPSGLSSRVNPLPAFTSDTSFRVSWARLDNSGGEVRFDIQYKEGLGGPWQDWLRGTRDTAATFGPTAPLSPKEGEAYLFRSRAVASDGRSEPFPAGGCACDTSIGIALKLRGRVQDPRGLPIAGATVRAGDDFITTTDSQGEYRLPVYPAAPYELRAFKDGYGLVPGRLLEVTSSFSYDFALPPTVNLLQNWGFEGNGGVQEWWTPGGQTSTATTYMHSGRHAARLGELRGEARASLSQGVTIPPEMTTPYLSFFYSMLGTPHADDRFTVSVRGSEKTVRAQVPVRNTPWTLYALDLGDLRGPAEVVFTYEQRQESSARVFLDEVSLGPAAERPVFRSFVPFSPRALGRGW